MTKTAAHIYRREAPSECSLCQRGFQRKDSILECSSSGEHVLNRTTTVYGSQSMGTAFLLARPPAPAVFRSRAQSALAITILFPLLTVGLSAQKTLPPFPVNPGFPQT